MRKLFALAAFALATAAGWSHANEVVVYSARNEQLIKPLFDAYTRKTGVAVKFVTDNEAALLARLKAEGDKTPADVLMTVDAGNLWLAAQDGVLRPTHSAALKSAIPAHLRDPGDQWFGLSVRARTIVYNTRRVKPQDLSTYEDLADPKWKGRLCLRSSKKVYNQSLVATLIKAHGEARTESIVRGWVANLAAPPFSDDTKAMEAVAAGQCDVTLVNTYYFGRLMAKRADLPLAVFWPNQVSGVAEDGVHVNVSGAGITRHARRPDEARKLLEWLASPEAQNLYADQNLEYPANPAVAATPAVAAWGRFRQSTVNMAEAGRLQSRAVMLMDRAGYK